MKTTSDGHSREWSVHVCPDSEERAELGPFGPSKWRVHVNTPWLHVAVALTKEAMFAGRMRPEVLPRWQAMSEVADLAAGTALGLRAKERARELSSDPASRLPASHWMIRRNR